VGAPARTPLGSYQSKQRLASENMIAVGLPTEVETMDMGKGAIVLPFAGKAEGKNTQKSSTIGV
jgi:hypothetical protein